MSVGELIAERQRLEARARRLASQLTDDAPEDRVRELERQIEEIGEERDELQSQIDAIASGSASRSGGDPRAPRGEDRVATGRPGSGEDPRAPIAPASERWFDRDGREVRVLRPDERMADGVQRQVRRDLGAVMRGLAVGAGDDPELRAVLAEGTDSLGGYTVPTPLASTFIDRVRARTAALRAGARTVAMDAETLAIAKTVSDPVAAWRDENATINESDMTFGQVFFRARSLAVLVRASRELLADTVNAGEALVAALAGAFAVELDRVALSGSGTAPEPEGVINNSSVTEVTPGDYAAIGFDELVDVAAAVRQANHQPTAAVWHPLSAAANAKLKDTQNRHLEPPRYLQGLQYLEAGGLPTDLERGGGPTTGLAPIVIGDFSQLFIGMRQQLQIDVLNERYADNHQVGFVAHMRADIALAHPGAFAFVLDKVA